MSMYKETKARNCEIKNFAGIDFPYEKSENPELTIDTSDGNSDIATDQIMNFVKKYL